MSGSCELYILWQMYVTRRKSFLLSYFVVNLVISNNYVFRMRSR